LNSWSRYAASIWILTATGTPAGTSPSDRILG
jgi:hypothetical protein